MSFWPCVAKLWAPNALAARRRVIPVLQSPASWKTERALNGLGPSTDYGFRSLYSTRSADPTIIKQLQEEREHLLRALAGRDVSELVSQMRHIRKLFYSFPHRLRPQVSVPYFQLTRVEIESMLKKLSRRGKPEDVETLSTILQDSRNIYNVEPDSPLIQSVLHALVRTGHPMKAYEYFQYRWWRPNSQHWFTVMNGFAQQGDVANVKMCLEMMKRSWPFPGNPHYRALLAAMLEHGNPSLTEVKQVMEEMKALNLAFDPRTEALLLEIARQYSEDEGNVFLNGYQTFNRPCYTPEQLRDWIVQLADARLKCRKSNSEFEGKFRNFRMQGFVPDERALARLVQISITTTCEELEYLEEVFEVHGNVIVWSIVLRNAVEKGGVRAAQAVYRAARAAGIQPDAAMVHPLLRALCNGRLREPSEANVDYAIQIYDDLQAVAANYNQLIQNSKAESNTMSVSSQQGSMLSTVSDADGQTTLSSVGRGGADTAVFNSLLRALAASSNREKYFPIALRLLSDMQGRRVPLDPMTTASTAVLLIRAARTPEDAAAAYRRVRDVAHPVLDEKGYVAVLHALCGLDPFDAFLSAKTQFVFDEETVDEESGDSMDMNAALDIFYSPCSDSALADSVVPRRSLLRWGPEDPNSPAIHMHIFFEVVADMRAQGLRPPAGVYTVLASQCGKLATRAREVQRRKKGTVGFSSNQRAGLRALRMTIVNMLDEVFSRVALGLHVMDATSPPPFISIRDSTVQKIRNLGCGNNRYDSNSTGGGMNTDKVNINSNAIIPDSPLLNALLDAYARAGAFSRALRVWRILSSRDLVTSASASVVFDAIGHNLEESTRYCPDDGLAGAEEEETVAGKDSVSSRAAAIVASSGDLDSRRNHSGTARDYAWELADQIFRELLLCAGAPAADVFASELGGIGSPNMNSNINPDKSSNANPSSGPSNTASAYVRALPLPPSAALLLTPRVWAAWVECLCRLRRVDDAVRVVCFDMLPATDLGKQARGSAVEVGSGAQIQLALNSDADVQGEAERRNLDPSLGLDVEAMEPAVRVVLTFAQSISPERESAARDAMRSARLPAELYGMKI